MRASRLIPSLLPLLLSGLVACVPAAPPSAEASEEGELAFNRDFAPEGSVCGPHLGITCGPGLLCDDGVCRKRNPQVDDAGQLGFPCRTNAPFACYGDAACLDDVCQRVLSVRLSSVSTGGYPIAITDDRYGPPITATVLRRDEDPMNGEYAVPSYTPVLIRSGRVVVALPGLAAGSYIIDVSSEGGSWTQVEEFDYVPGIGDVQLSVSF